MGRPIAVLLALGCVVVGCGDLLAPSSDTPDAGGAPPDAAAPDATVADGGAAPRTLYVFGGGQGNWGLGGDGGASVAEVLSATIQPDGTLGAWTSRPALPRPQFHSNPAVVTDHFVTLVGEYGTPVSGPQPTVVFADLAGSGTWAATAPLDKGLGGWESTYGVASDGTHIVVLGGDPVAPTRVRQTTALATGGVTAWTDAPALPFALDRVAAVTSGGTLYAYGHATGDGGASILTDVRAKLGTNGVEGWQTSSTAIPSEAFVGVAALGSHLFVAGGSNVNNAATDHVWVATIGTDGAPSPLAASAPLPSPTTNACVIAGPNALYVIGGEPGGGQLTSYAHVFMAVPDPEGNIGSWRETTPLPSARAGASCVVY